MIQESLDAFAGPRMPLERAGPVWASPFAHTGPARSNGTLRDRGGDCEGAPRARC
jgi:hypothetical protein